jgi:hypothetical protein
MKHYQALKATDKCIALTPDIKVEMLENIYEMVCESKIVYGIEVWGLNGAWKEVDKVHSIFCKKRYAKLCSKWIAEMELGRESRRSKCLGRILKYWYSVMFLETRTDKTML